ncbi:adenylate/guanylate cyclase domain-containing protein [Turneriella parva]|uniref:Adenylate cyclase n=1 Tax=Turneriella parva (strain ATCC BAA-1111 / DSM 21527 / NCTC 11395 / H) TaxID=869212 RepID=I4B4M8_TURPD|nr:adenylate/guanylate cyclase domain-containing protein [Turneriella parva]AFM12235.1 adenylate/guanylate cyclase with GAF sensor(s) [Turneriella parva DSM 21527]
MRQHLFHFWQVLVNVGVNYAALQSEQKFVQITNGICAYSIVGLLLQLPLFIPFLPESGPLLVICLISLVGMSLTFVFNFYGFLRAATLSMHAIATVTMATTAVLLGREGNVHFIHLSVLLAAAIAYPARWMKTIITVCVVSLSAFFFIEFSAPSWEPMLILPKEFYELFRITGISTFVAVIVSFSAFSQIVLRSTEKSLQAEKDKALASQRASEQLKDDTEILNGLLRSLNEDMNLNVVMAKVHRYVAEAFGLDWYILYGVSPDKRSLQMLLMHADDSVSEATRQKTARVKIPIDRGIGGHAHAIRTKKPLYVPNLKSPRIIKASAPEEIANAETYGLQSTVLLPLVLRNESVGLLNFSSRRKIVLSRNEITRLSIITEQIAGVIHSSRLFEEVRAEREKSEKLLLNILPQDVAVELKEKGYAEPVQFEAVSVLFTDFEGFTRIAEHMSPNELVKELDACFGQFDKVIERHRLEKLKTIGDSYMCAGGVPRPGPTHAIDCVLAAMEIRSFMMQMQEIKKSLGEPYWQLRIGIHSGPLVAGVIGEKKFAYDVWGDTVNTASRMESSGNPDKINISGATYDLIKEYFDCEYRGRVSAKNKGEIDMYFVIGLKSEYSRDPDCRVPNGKFWASVSDIGIPATVTA